MGSAAEPRILLCADEAAAVADVKQHLEAAGHLVDWHPLGSAAPKDLSCYHLVVLEGSRRNGESLQLCRRLRIQAAEGFIPILFVTDDPTPAARLASYESGADAYLLRPFEPGELLAQVRAFLRIKEMHQCLSEKTAEIHHVNRRLQQAYQRIDDELELARRIQQSFLPQTLPVVTGVRFAVHYRPCGRVGGDFYDVFRLDENHVGFYVADAMGHGLPASLLTIFLKKGVHAKEIFGQQYRLVPPDEVLQRLNHELIEHGVSEKPFITMVYGLLDCHTGTFCFARAGHPHPLHLSAERGPELWQSPGTLLGVFEAEFMIQTHQLQPGDKVLFYTDGAEAVSFEGRSPGTESMLACVARHKALPIQALIDKLAEELVHDPETTDDVTMLGLEMGS